MSKFKSRKIKITPTRLEKVLSIEDKREVGTIIEKRKKGLRLSDTETNILNSPDVRLYMDKVLNDAGLQDEYLGQSLKKVIDASITEESLVKINPATGLSAIDMVMRLKDRYPATKIESKNMNLDVSLRGASVNDLKSMLTDLDKQTKEFLSLIQPDEASD